MSESIGLKPGEPPIGANLAIRAWNLLGHASLTEVADVLGFDDMEILVVQIEAIRDFQKKGQV